MSFERSSVETQIFGTFDRHLELKTWEIIDVVCATYLANYLGKPPLWLVVVGPSSSAKTTIIRSLHGLPNVYPVSGFTANTFASGSINKKVRVGILEKITDETDPETGRSYSCGLKFFTIVDVGQLFALKGEIKGQLLAQLRDIYDGRFVKEWGTGKRLDWTGNVGLIAASTHSWDLEGDVFRAMGERFLLWREEVPTGGQRKKAIGKAMQQLAAEVEMELQEAMQLLGRLDQLEAPEVPWEDREWLGDVAERISHLRTPILRDRTGMQQMPPRPEFPARLAQQLHRFMQGMMIWRGVDGSDREVMQEQIRPVTFRLALGSVPLDRLEILRAIGEDEAETEEIADAVGYAPRTARQKLEDLELLKVTARVPGLMHRRIVMPDWREFVRGL